MATNRFQFSDDFVLKNGRVGINSADPQAELDVRGTIKADNLTVTGVATFTAYEGFLRSDYNIDESLTITNGSALSGEVIVGTGVTATNNAIDYAGQGQIDSLKVYNTFTPPRGGTEERPTKAKPGQLYYNEDFKTIEFYTGEVWRQVDNTTRSGRGVMMGGRDTPGATVSEIDYIQVTTLGNSQNFGDLVSGSMESGACCADSTRALKTGGTSGGTEYNNIDYVTIASQGNSIDFGDLQAETRGHGCCSSSSRGVTGGGVISPNSDTNRMDYIQIQTLGNALDFGDLVVTERNPSMISSPTRGVHDGGNVPNTTTLGHFTIASKGNSVEFGSNSRSAYNGGVVGNSIRGIFCGGYNASGASEGIKKIEYITFASLGKTTNFGELSGLVSAGTGGMSNNSRGVIGPGNRTFTGSVDLTNTLEYITISTLGNSQDFGDVSGPMKNFTPKVSDSHGGLGGF
jgi:hypothetical protein